MGFFRILAIIFGATIITSYADVIGAVRARPSAAEADQQQNNSNSEDIEEACYEVLSQFYFKYMHTSSIINYYKKYIYNKNSDSTNKRRTRRTIRGNRVRGQVC
jgi:hypothetical protein